MDVSPDRFPEGLIDAHHHVWNPVSADPDLGYAWLRDVGARKPFGDPTPIQRDYLMDEFLAEPAPLALDASVHVQADNGLPDPVAETAWVAAEAARAGHRVGVVGLVDLAAPDAAARIARHAAHPEFRGVRQVVARLEDRPEMSFAPRDLLGDPAWREGLAALAEAGGRFDLQLYPEQAERAARALEGLPGLPVVVDHAACPHDRSAAGLARWRDAVALLAERPATAIKLSGWGMHDPGWSAASIAPLVAHVIARFGPGRVMWGSNHPVEKLARPYRTVLAATLRALPASDAGTRGAIFAGTARRVYDL